MRERTIKTWGLSKGWWCVVTLSLDSNQRGAHHKHRPFDTKINFGTKIFYEKSGFLCNKNGKNLQPTNWFFSSSASSFSKPPIVFKNLQIAQKCHNINCKDKYQHPRDKFQRVTFMVTCEPNMIFTWQCCSFECTHPFCLSYIALYCSMAIQDMANLFKFIPFTTSSIPIGFILFNFPLKNFIQRLQILLLNAQPAFCNDIEISSYSNSINQEEKTLNEKINLQIIAFPHQVQKSY